MRRILTGLPLILLLAGCASGHPARTSANETTRSAADRGLQTNHDAKIVRGMLDSMASPAHNYPANLPR